MIKICTSIEQSEKLIEFGIDVNTADMYWWAISIRYSAWSLEALLELMPLHIIENNVRYEFQIVKGLNKEGGTYKIKYKGYTSLFETLMYNEPIDAAFEMVCWLKENGKI